MKPRLSGNTFEGREKNKQEISMEKLKKFMTIMAIAGIVLVTAVFCYIPLHEVIKEMRKNTVSVAGEESLGGTEASAEDLWEDMTQMSQNTTEGSQDNTELTNVPAEEGEFHRAVLFEIEQEEEKMRTCLWQSSEGICYVLLPGFAKEAALQVDELENNGWFTIGNRILEEGDVITDFSFEEAYEFVLYDRNGEKLMAAPLFFMHSSDLPVLSLSTESGDMENINSGKNVAEVGKILLFDETGKMMYEGAATEISGRGNSTFGLLKKPYRFKLREGADLLGFGKNKDYNLLAEGYDESKLRNQIVMDMARELGMEYVPDGQSVDLYCNDVYYGIYYLCEKVEIGKTRIDIADLEENTKAVYNQAELKRMESIESEDYTRKWTNNGVESDDLSGGYLFEREIRERYWEESSGFMTTQHDTYVLKSPKYATENQVNYIADYMQNFQDAVEEKDGINGKTGKHYSEYIDVDSFVYKYLIEEVSRNYDGGVTSSYFYKKSDAEGGKLYAGPVWDYDVAFGNCNLDEIVSNPIGISKLNDHIYGTALFANLYEQEDFYNQVVSVYEQKVVPYLTYLLEEGIDKLSEETKQAVKLDDIRWQELQNRYRYYNDYENEIRYLKYFIEKRMDFLNEVWLEGEVYHSVSFVVDGYLWKEYYVKDGETLGAEPVPCRYNSLFMGWLSEENDVPYDEFKPVYEDWVFYATWQQLPETEVIITDGVSEQ